MIEFTGYKTEELLVAMSLTVWRKPACRVKTSRENFVQIRNRERVLGMAVQASLPFLGLLFNKLYKDLRQFKFYCITCRQRRSLLILEKGTMKFT